MPYFITYSLANQFMPNISWIDDYSTLSRMNVIIDGGRHRAVNESGIPLNANLVPRRAVLKSKSKNSLCDFVPMQFRRAVVDEFKNKVEELEPGVHQFFPIEIHMASGELLDKKYWLMNICNRVDAIDEEASLLRKHEVGNRHVFYRDGISDGKEAKLVFRHERIEGMAMWIDKHFPEGPFFSDALMAFIKEKNLKKIEPWKVYQQ